MDGEKPGPSKPAAAEAAAVNRGILQPTLLPHISKILKNENKK